ncbi:hypothetical protein NPX13_g8875 [Xylaria arbuscula]|uniref:Uncharacterized protein n=1 Tax=Xylaria arbuscula TaxID=114810 RepID=A0A9W8N7F1_9PEZI|nr:hypothetical protein NPX13_g8875 [Xylaria arbuscula]
MRATATSTKRLEGRILKKSSSKKRVKSKARRHGATAGPNDLSAAKVQSMNQSINSVRGEEKIIQRWHYRMANVSSVFCVTNGEA